MNSKEGDNRTRPIPKVPHWDKTGREGYLAATYPQREAESLVGQLSRTKGYIRGDHADNLYEKLKPHLDMRAESRSVAVPTVESWARETPAPDFAGRHFRTIKR